MLVCGDCGAVFEDAQKVVETHGLDMPPYEEFEACPDCYGSCVVEGFPCDCCSEYITDCYVQVDSGERYCDSCYVIKEFPD